MIDVKSMFVKIKHSENIHHACHRSHDGMHFVYLLVAYIEGHGIEAYVCLALFGLSVVNTFIFGDKPE